VHVDRVNESVDGVLQDGSHGVHLRVLLARVALHLLLVVWVHHFGTVVERARQLAHRAAHVPVGDLLLHQLLELLVRALAACRCGCPAFAHVAQLLLALIRGHRVRRTYVAHVLVRHWDRRLRRHLSHVPLVVRAVLLSLLTEDGGVEDETTLEPVVENGAAQRQHAFLDHLILLGRFEARWIVVSVFALLRRRLGHGPLHEAKTTCHGRRRVSCNRAGRAVAVELGAQQVERRRGRRALGGVCCVHHVRSAALQGMKALQAETIVCALGPWAGLPFLVVDEPS
jgi:hypothetical protein